MVLICCVGKKTSIIISGLHFTELPLMLIYGDFAFLKFHTLRSRDFYSHFKDEEIMV